MEEKKKQMVSIWSWVGAVLAAYGLIVFSCGIYYMQVSNIIAERSHNPGLWWGCIMLVAAIVFLLAGRAGNRQV